MGPRFRIIPEMIDGARLSVELDIPSDLRYVGATAGYFSRLAREHGFPEIVWAENLPLAMDEAVTNAIRHGNGESESKQVKLIARLENGELEIRVQDEGEGFDPDSLPDPREDASIFRTSGRGVFLMRTLCDEVCFEDSGRRVNMLFRKNDVEEA
jgi:serine/threonine-protein kinase RsbW